MMLPESITKLIDHGLETAYALRPWVEPTLILVPNFVRTGISNLAETTGLDVDVIDMTLGLFLCYPLGMIINKIPLENVNVRHMVSFFFGVFLLQFTNGVQWIHHVITSLIVYGLFLLLSPRAAVLVVPTFTMSYLVLGHLHRLYINYLGYDMDFTGAQMVLTIKLHTMAFNLYDGYCLRNGIDSRAAQKCSTFALSELPTFIEYLGYTFCFSNVLVGPGFEFTTYRNAINGSVLRDPVTGKLKYPNNVRPVLLPLLTSLIAMVMTLVLESKFPLNDPNDKDPQYALPIILKESFLAKPWYTRLAYVWMAILAFRQKYFFGWKNAEGALNVWYAGFEGYDEQGNPKGWENSNNVDILDYELAPNLQTTTKAWNKKTSLWLTRYVYIRTNGSLVATYSLAAFWHGFYPGYYLTFMSVPLMTQCERIGRKHISSRFSNNNGRFSTLYSIVCVIVSSVLFKAYLIIPFATLDFHRSINFWKSFYFLGHILAVLFYVVVSQIPMASKKDKPKKE